MDYEVGTYRDNNYYFTIIITIVLYSRYRIINIIISYSALKLYEKIDIKYTNITTICSSRQYIIIAVYFLVSSEIFCRSNIIILQIYCMITWQICSN